MRFQGLGATYLGDVTSTVVDPFGDNRSDRTGVLIFNMSTSVPLIGTTKEIGMATTGAYTVPGMAAKGDSTEDTNFEVLPRQWQFIPANRAIGVFFRSATTASIRISAKEVRE